MQISLERRKKIKEYHQETCFSNSGLKILVKTDLQVYKGQLDKG